MEGSLDYGENEGQFTETHQQTLWRVIDDLRDEGVATSYIVMALLDNAVDLTATQLVAEGDAYLPFVEATAAIFNHYATLGVADCNQTW